MSQQRDADRDVYEERVLDRLLASLRENFRLAAIEIIARDKEAREMMKSKEGLLHVGGEPGCGMRKA